MTFVLSSSKIFANQDNMHFGDQGMVREVSMDFGKVILNIRYYNFMSPLSFAVLKRKSFRFVHSLICSYWFNYKLRLS